MALKWYSLRTYSGKEKRTSETILQEAELAGLSELIPEVLVPSENVVVMSFVGPKGEPVPLKDVEVRRILGEVEERDGQEVMGTIFKAGDPIKVIDGPFVDFTGFVKEVDETKQKVKVEVSIFGRPTPVELDFLQIELEK